MATKKDFSKLNNPADQFMEEMESTTNSQANRTGGNQSKPSNKASESRSQHASFLLKPSTANSLKFIAKFEGTSANNIANKLLDDYVKKYRENPDKAQKLDQALELFS